MAKNISVGRLTIEMVAETVQYTNKLKEAELETDKKLSSIIKTFNKTGKASDKAGKKFNTLSDRLRDAAQTAQLVDGPLGGVASRLNVMSSILSKGGLIGATVALSAALFGVFKVLSHGVSVLDKTHMFMAKLEVQSNLTGNSIGASSDAINDFAESLAFLTLGSVEDSREALSVLANANLSFAQSQRAATIAADIAAAGFGSMGSNARKLSQILKDPVKNLDKLTRENIRFTDAEKLSIETLVKHGKIQQAQNIILTKAAAAYAGISKSLAAETVSGAVDTLGQAFDGLTESFANTVGAAPAVVSTLNWLSEAFRSVQETIESDDVSAGKSGRSKLVAQLKAITDGGVTEIRAIGIINESLVDERKKLSANRIKLEDELAQLAKAKIDIAKGGGNLNRSRDVAQDRAMNTKRMEAVREELEIGVFRQKEISAQLTETENKLIGIGTRQNNARTIADKAKADEAIKAAKKSSSEAAKKRANLLKGEIAQSLRDNKTQDIQIKARIKRVNEIIATARIDGVNLNFGDIYNLTDDDFQSLRNGLALNGALIKAQNVELLKEAMSHQKLLDDIRAGHEVTAAAGGADSQMALLREKYDEELRLHKHMLDTKKLNEDQYALVRKNAETLIAEESMQIHLMQQEQATAGLQTTLDSMSEALAAAGKEGSGVAKALFLAGKAVSFANTMIATQAAAAQAAANPLLLDPASKAAAAAAVEAQGMVRLAAIAATGLAGIAHGGIDNVPNEGTFLLQKGERVIQPKANVALENFLKNPDQGGGATTINAPLTITGNVTDKAWFQQELYKHRQHIAAMNRKANAERPRR